MGKKKIIKEQEEQLKDYSSVNSVEVKKRGRPKKEVFVKKKEEVIVIRSLVSKHMGYCPACELGIIQHDCVDNRFRCKGCGEEALIKKLKLERKIEKRNKKDDWEYLHDLERTVIERNVIERKDL